MKNDLVIRRLDLRGEKGRSPDLALFDLIQEIGPTHRVVSTTAIRWFYDGDCPRQYRLAELLVVFERRHVKKTSIV